MVLYLSASLRYTIAELVKIFDKSGRILSSKRANVNNIKLRVSESRLSLLRVCRTGAVSPSVNVANFSKIIGGNYCFALIFCVTLHSQSDLKNTRDSATRCSWPSRIILIPKNTRLWRRLFMKCTRTRTSTLPPTASSTLA